MYCYKEYKKCVVNGEEYTSLNSRLQRSCAIDAKWRGVTGIDSRGEAPIRVGQVVSFILHHIDVSPNSASSSTCKKSIQHILVHVQWFGDHPRRDYFHSSVMVCSTVLEDESAASFMPVSCRCAVSTPLSVNFDYGLDHIIVSVPLVGYLE